MRRFNSPARFVGILMLSATAVACNGNSAGTTTEVSTSDASTASAATTESDSESNTASDTLASSTTSDVAASATEAASEAVPCEFERANQLPIQPVCYQVSVPEDWSNPDPDDQVVLQVAVFGATDGSGAADPMVYFDGGPGADTLDGLAFAAASLVAPYIDARDVVVFDQRGVGTSEPSLDCEEVREFNLANNQGEVAADTLEADGLAAVDACHERLVDDGVDLAAYNTEASARDADAIRSALGYEQWNVLGVSYGTRLAQTYMRLFPESLRSVILDSVVPTESDPISEIPVSMERSLRLVIDACAQDAECSATYPDFAADLVTLTDRFADEPGEVEVTDFDGTSYTFVISDRSFSSLLAAALYDPVLFASLPQTVAEGLDQNYTLIGRLFQVSLVQNNLFSPGMQYSVMCRDEAPFESAQQFDDNLPTDTETGVLAVGLDEFDFFKVCAEWPVGEAPPVENEPVVSDVPTLVLSGTFDPVTPPSFGELVAGHLDNSYVFEFPTEGHAVSRSLCGTQIVAAFLDDPSKSPDSSCLADLPAPEWVLGDTVDDVTMVDFEVTSPIELRGVRPEGWTGAGPGVFVRQVSLADPTALVMQATGGAPADALVSQLNSQLGATLEPVEATEVDGEAWDTYTALSDQAAGTGETEVLLMLSPANDLFIVLIALPNQFDQLVDKVAIPVAAGLQAG